MADETQHLGIRIEQVTRQNGRSNTIGIVFIAAFAATLLLGQATPVPEVAHKREKKGLTDSR